MKIFLIFYILTNALSLKQWKAMKSTCTRLANILDDVKSETNAKGVNLMISLSNNELKSMLGVIISRTCTVYVNHSNIKMIRYRRKKITYQTENSKINVEWNGTVILHSTGQIPLVYLINFKSPIAALKELEKFHNTYILTSQAENLPKVLLVFYTNKRLRNYRRVYNFLTHKRIIDVTILEIAMSQKRKRKSYFLSRKRNTKKHVTKYTVHHFTPFTKVYRTSRYSRASKFFPFKHKNYRGFLLKITSSYADLCNFRKLSVDVGGPLSILMRSMKQCLNYTYKRIGYKRNLENTGKTKDGNNIDMIYPLVVMNLPYTESSHIKLNQVGISSMYVPIIKD